MALNACRARCFWEPELPEDFERSRLTKLEKALEYKTGFLRHYVHTYLEQKRASKLEFVSVINVQPSHYYEELSEAMKKVGYPLPVLPEHP